MQSHYNPLKQWKTRQHFIDAAQHPMKDVVVVGEMVALNQGWVEGALESVHNGLLIKKQFKAPITSSLK